MGLGMGMGMEEDPRGALGTLAGPVDALPFCTLLYISRGSLLGIGVLDSKKVVGIQKLGAWGLFFFTRLCH